MSNIFGAAIVMAILMGDAVRAAPVTINFDDLSPGAFPSYVSVTTQYAAQGVVFSGPGVGGPAFAGSSGLVVSGMGLPFGTYPNAGLLDSHVTATFATNVSSVSLSFLVPGGSPHLIIGAIDAFDSHGALLGSVSGTPTIDLGSYAISTLTLSAPGIRSITFYSVHFSSTVVDDLIFDTMPDAPAVPLPPSAAILVFGLAGIGGMRRRKP